MKKTPVELTDDEWELVEGALVQDNSYCNKWRGEIKEIIDCIKAAPPPIETDPNITEAIIKDIHDFIIEEFFEVSRAELADLARYIRERLRISPFRAKGN